MKIGDRIVFGNHSWIVLDIQNDKALLLTEYIIADGRCTGGVRPALWLKL